MKKGFDFPEGVVEDGRPLTDYERETLTILLEECNEVAKECLAVATKITKLLRFGTDQTNPTTQLKNHVELSEEIGDLNVVLARATSLSIFDAEACKRGVFRKIEKLKHFTQYAPDKT